MLHGRYGNDQFNQALSLLGLVLIGLQILLGLFIRNSILIRLLSLLWLACIAYMLFRMFSKKYDARRRENEWFMRFWYSLQNRMNTIRHRGPRARAATHNPTFEERRKFKYFACTQCSQRLRVPRGKGKLRVTCTRCGNKFEIKS